MVQDSCKRSKSVKFNSVPEVFTITPQSSPSGTEKRPKSKGKASTSRLTPGSSQPDLDIVSGFAFLSFESCDELEAHIEQKEVNTQSLSVDVGQKRKIISTQIKRAASEEYFPSKKAKPSAKKRIVGNASILKAKRAAGSSKLGAKTDTESRSENIGSTFTITASSLSSITSSEHGSISLQSALMDSISSHVINACDKQHPSGPGDDSLEEISLECSEKMDTLAIEEDLVKSPPPQEGLIGKSVLSEINIDQDVKVGNEEKKKRKKKRKKRDRHLNDQTCQTMFRIKKKKKFRSADNVEVAGRSSFACDASSAGQMEGSDRGEDDVSVELEILPDGEGSLHKHSSVGVMSNITDPNGNDVKSQLSRTCSKRVEKIDYCARSGGIGLLKRHHTKKAAELNEKNEETSSLESDQQPQESDINKNTSVENVSLSPPVTPSPKVVTISPPVTPSPKVVTLSPPVTPSPKVTTSNASYNVSESSFDDVYSPQVMTSAGVTPAVMQSQDDAMSDTSGNESNNTNEQNIADFSDDGYSQTVYRKKSIEKEKAYFLGSSTEKYDKNDELTVEGDTIDIETAESDVSKTFVVVSTVRGLNESYMLGQVTMYPEKTSAGTVDVSIQSYDNDIQLYMKHASEQEGRIIKIISAEDEEDGSGTVPNFLGLPKFLRPPEHVKAVRSATERSRRLAIGDLFCELKRELFTELDLYFSKQAILSKAIGTIERLEKDVKSSKEAKKEMKRKNAELRKRLNMKLFGKDLPEGKVVDIEKLVPLFKRNMNIDIVVPPKTERKLVKVEVDNVSEPSTEKNVTYVHSRLEMKHTCTSGDSIARKGRPPQLGKFVKLFQKTQEPTTMIQPRSMLAATPLAKRTDAGTAQEVKVAGEGNMVAKQQQVKVAAEGIVVAKQQPVKVAVIGTACDNVAGAQTSSGAKLLPPVSKANQSLTQTFSLSSPAIDNLRKVTEKTISNSKILCNLSRFNVRQSNTEAVFKGMDSKDVVHIKIENDTMQRVGAKEETQSHSKPQLVAFQPIPLSNAGKSKTPVTKTGSTTASASTTSTVTMVAVGTQSNYTNTVSSHAEAIPTSVTPGVVPKADQSCVVSKNVQLMMPGQTVASVNPSAAVKVQPHGQLINVTGNSRTFRLVTNQGQKIVNVTPVQKPLGQAGGSLTSLPGQNTVTAVPQSGLHALLSGGNLVKLQGMKPAPLATTQAPQQQRVIFNTRMGAGRPNLQQTKIQQLPPGVSGPSKLPISQVPQTYRSIAPSPVSTPVAQPMRFQLVKVPVAGQMPSGTPATQTSILIPVKPGTTSIGNTNIVKPVMKPAAMATTPRFASPLNSPIVRQNQPKGSQTVNMLMSISNTGKVSFSLPVTGGQTAVRVATTAAPGQVPTAVPGQVTGHTPTATTTSTDNVTRSTAVMATPLKTPNLLSGKPFTELEKMLAKLSPPDSQTTGSPPSLENTQTTMINTASRSTSVPTSSGMADHDNSPISGRPCLNSGKEALGMGNLGAQTSTVPLNVESLVKENVVTADKLSCNIENSIPDIASELPADGKELRNQGNPEPSKVNTLPACSKSSTTVQEPTPTTNSDTSTGNISLNTLPACSKSTTTVQEPTSTINRDTSTGNTPLNTLPACSKSSTTVQQPTATINSDAVTGNSPLNIPDDSTASDFELLASSLDWPDVPQAGSKNTAKETVDQ